MDIQNREMPKAYDPLAVEEELYNWWEQHGFFRPEQQIESGLADPNAEPFVISMPPPNVTGALHLGHAITSSIEDMLIRYHRMLGRPTLWVPGTDHAGIATQNVVERKLEEQGTSREELGRTRFIQEVWDWKDEYHNRITGQQRRMGISCDWHRERFTLDDESERAQLGKANTLQSLGDLETRLGNVDAARQHYDDALPLYEVEQNPTGTMNTFVSLARLALSTEQIDHAIDWFEKTFTIADQINFGDHPVVQEWRNEYEQLKQFQAQGLSPADMNAQTEATQNPLAQADFKQV